MNMGFTSGQNDTLSKYFSDVSKILVGSAVVGFFVPTGVGPITTQVFVGGTAIAIVFLLISIKLAH